MDHHVSGGVIVGIIFSLIISVGVPVALAVIFKKKFKAPLSAFFIGAGTFIVFALVLESIMHNIVLGAAGDTLTGNIWLYALYGGLAAGVFEETGRFLSMKFLMKKGLTKENAIMYGIGHGGIEAIIIIGFAEISNIAMSLAINMGQYETIISAVPEEQRETFVTQLAPLWEGPAYLFFLTGVERISAIMLHISFSYIVYRAVKDKKVILYVFSTFLHFFADAVFVLVTNFVPMIAVEAIIFAISAAIFIFVIRAYKKEEAPKILTPES